MKTLKEAIAQLSVKIDDEKFNFKVMQGRETKKEYLDNLKAFKSLLYTILNSDFEYDALFKRIKYKNYDLFISDNYLMIYHSYRDEHGRYINKEYSLKHNIVDCYDTLSNLYKILDA